MPVFIDLVCSCTCFACLYFPMPSSFSFASAVQFIFSVFACVVHAIPFATQSAKLRWWCEPATPPLPCAQLASSTTSASVAPMRPHRATSFLREAVAAARVCVCVCVCTCTAADADADAPDAVAVFSSATPPKTCACAREVDVAAAAAAECAARTLCTGLLPLGVLSSK